jgi:transcription elongation factor GreA
MGERLTPSDVEKIEKEIEHRKLVVRKEAIAAVKEARAQGDLSENFEYYAAKRDKNQNESRIRYLERMLKNATIIEDHSSSDEVGINTIVTLYIPEDDCEETYKLVTSIRSSSLRDMVSIESPLGKAIRGKRVGETATVVVDDNYSYDVVIRSIEKNVGDEDDQIRKY